MNKGSRVGASNKSASSKSRKNRNRIRTVSSSTPLPPVQTPSDSGVSSAYIRPAVQPLPVVTQFLHIRGELKRIAIISAAMLILLIILALIF